jgi:hypothetical protein
MSLQIFLVKYRKGINSEATKGETEHVIREDVQNWNERRWEEKREHLFDTNDKIWWHKNSIISSLIFSLSP